MEVEGRQAPRRLAKPSVASPREGHILGGAAGAGALSHWFGKASCAGTDRKVPKARTDVIQHHLQCRKQGNSSQAEPMKGANHPPCKV